MKGLILAFVVFSSGAATAYSDEAVKDAEEFYQLIQDRFKVGEVSTTEVLSAQRYLLDMKYHAGILSRRDYCRDAVDAQQKFVQAVMEEARVGQRSTEEVAAAKRTFFKLKAKCK